MRTAGCLAFLVLALLAVSPSGAAAVESLGLEVIGPKAGQYERVDFRLQVPRQYRNPFDPEEVSVWLQVTTPGGARVAVPAFFGQDYRRRESPEGDRREWLYPEGQPGWKARFAWGETGPYTAVARLKDARGTLQSDPVRFEVGPSKRHGFLRVSNVDPRFLAFDDGTPYFAIGHNHAFVGNSQYAGLGRTERIFDAIARNGGNFLRIWVCCHDWATAIEARKSAWGRSWAWKPPIVPKPGDEQELKCVEITGEKGGALNVSTAHPLAAMPNTRYVLSGEMRTEPGAKVQVMVGRPLGEAISAGDWAKFSRPFTTGPEQRWIDPISFRREGNGKAWLDRLSLREAEGGPELLWEADVNRAERGYYNPVDCFVVDKLVEAAEKTGLYLQLTIVTRDLYMDALKDPKSPAYQQAIADCRKLMRYSAARWGYSPHVAAWEYFNEIDPSLPTDRFYDEIGKHLEQVDPYRHLRTTSCWHPSPKDWRHDRLEIAQAHHYLQPASKQGFKDEVDAGLKAIGFLLTNTRGKPALMAEFGLAENNCQLSSYMKQDKELVHFHNAVWMSALSGTSGTAAFWWWEQLDQMGAYRHYKPLAAFLADVPWTTAGLHDAAATATAGVRPVGLAGKQCAYVWLYNPAACWWNLAVEKKAPAEIRDAELEIPGLAPGSYRVQWWDTYEGKVLREEQATSREGALKVKVPAFARDLACKIVR